MYRVVVPGLPELGHCRRPVSPCRLPPGLGRVQPEMLAVRDRLQVGRPVMVLDLVLVVDPVPVRDRPVRGFPDHPVQQVSARILVVAVLFPQVPALPGPVDPGRGSVAELLLLVHETMISPGTTCRNSTKPRLLVHTRWSGVPITSSTCHSSASGLVGPAHRTRRSPFLVHTRWPARILSMRCSPCSVRTSVLPGRQPSSSSQAPHRFEPRTRSGRSALKP